MMDGHKALRQRRVASGCRLEVVSTSACGAAERQHQLRASANLSRFDFLQNPAKGASQNIPRCPTWQLGGAHAQRGGAGQTAGGVEGRAFSGSTRTPRQLGATIQALEVQKMTLATLKGMNFNMGDVANALKAQGRRHRGLGVHRKRRDRRHAAGTVSGIAAARRKTGWQTGAFRPMPAGVVDPRCSGGLADPAVPADRRLRDEGRRQTDRHRHHQKTWPPAWPKEAFKTCHRRGDAASARAKKGRARRLPRSR